MAIERITWRDEEIAPIMVNGAADHSPRYDILNRSNQVIIPQAKLALRNAVRVQGTSHCAENMNRLLQRADFESSFFYHPESPAPRVNFPQGYTGAGWRRLPDLPVDAGVRPLVFVRGDRVFATMGRVNEPVGSGADVHLTQNVAYYDIGAERWGHVTVNRNRSFANGPVPVSGGMGPNDMRGGIADWRVIGNQLFVVMRNLFPASANRPAEAWIDVLNLDTLVWTNGSVNIWPAGILTIGAALLAPDGQSAIFFGRNGVQGNHHIDSITQTSTAPVSTGMLPTIGGASNFAAVAATMLNDQYVIFIVAFGMMVFRSANLVNWSMTSAPPVGTHGLWRAIGSMRDRVAYAVAHQADPNLRFHDFAGVPSAINIGADVHWRYAATSGDFLAYMRGTTQGQGIDAAFETSRQWEMFDATTNTRTALPDAPEALDGYGFGAREDMLLMAINGRRAYMGRFGIAASGVRVGYLPRGLSIAASSEVFLVNERRTRVVSARRWVRADEDYMVCVGGRAACFGQIANV